MVIKLEVFKVSLIKKRRGWFFEGFGRRPDGRA